MKKDPRLQTLLDATHFVEELFDRVPGVVFFIKDVHGRYRAVNQTLVVRCGARSKRELLGRTAQEVFPKPLGSRFLEQDLAVCRGGSPITQQLELHLYPNRIEGWCLTDKIPLRADDGVVVGVAGISRDLQSAAENAEGLAELAAVLEHARAHYSSPLRVDDLARIAGFSIYQLNRRLRMVFGISASQLVAKTRIDAASAMLRSSSSSIADVAHACGYFDQSAFSRVFRRTVGVTPQQYRERHRL